MKIRVENKGRTGPGSAAHAIAKLQQEVRDAPKSVADLPADKLIAELTQGQKEGLCEALGLPKPVDPNSALGRARALNHAVKTDAALKGRALDALNLLANDNFNGLSGAALVKFLKMSVGPVDPEDGARDEMRAALLQNRNSNIAADGGSCRQTGKSTQAAGIWDRAIAKVYPA